jgi:hypothetical protein
MTFPILELVWYWHFKVKLRVKEQQQQEFNEDVELSRQFQQQQQLEIKKRMNQPLNKSAEAYIAPRPRLRLDSFLLPYLNLVNLHS